MDRFEHHSDNGEYGMKALAKPDAKQHKLFLPGQRIVRTVVAVLLCMLIYEARGRRGMPIFALIAAVMCITPYTRDTKAIAKRRVVGTLIGAGLGVITLLLEFRLFRMKEPDGIIHYAIAALGTGVVIYFTVWLRLTDIAQFAGIVFLIVVITQTGSSNVFQYAYHRIIDTLIGIAIGECVNRVHLKWLDFEEVADDGKPIAEIPLNKRNAIISLTVFVVSVALFIIQPFKWDLGLIAVSGATIVIALDCVDGRAELRNMMWPAIITLGAALAIADGFVQSGAGQVVIDFLVNTFGPAMTNPKVMVALFLLAGWLISMFMSNGSLVSMLASIAVPMAVEYGINPIPIAIACVIGSNLAMATPVATTTITMVQVAGYRFKDYFRLGGLVGIIGVITAWTAIVMLYGL